MLPSLLFKNVGLPATLTRGPALSASQAALRFRTPTPSALSSRPRRYYSQTSSVPSSAEHPNSADEARLRMTFTCTAPMQTTPQSICNHRSSHEFTKRAYSSGIVLIQCPECKNRHLIADHLGWFKDGTDNGRMRTVEDLMREKGEKVRRGALLKEGETLEFVE